VIHPLPRRAGFPGANDLIQPQPTETMGDKSPKSKQKQQSQKQTKNDAAGQAKQRQTDASREARSGGPPKKK